MAAPKTYSGNGRSVTLVDPDNIQRDECLALAMCGREAWNSWRAEHPVRNAGQGDPANFADFSNYELRGQSVDFSGFVFGEHANFSKCQFGWKARFELAVLGSRSTFSGARFESGLSFQGAHVGDFVRFDGIEVSGFAQFDAGHFGADCDFFNAIFSDMSFAGGASFTGAVFDTRAGFSCACILGAAHFDGAIFGGMASFKNVVFGDRAMMCATKFGVLADFSCDARYVVPASVDAALKRAGEGAGRASQRGTFQDVDFSGAIFQGAVDFTGRRFLGETNFGRMQQRCTFQRTVADGLQNETIERRSTVFVHAPSFHECKLHQNTSFEGASFPVAQGREAAARAYRTLKLAFAQQQATREEQRFFRLEMAEEAKLMEASRDPRSILFYAYRVFSDFGFSALRPLLLLIAGLLLAFLAYAMQADLAPCWAPSVECGMTGHLIQFTAAHAIPGFEKLAEPASKVLFGEHGERLGVWTVLTVLLHKTVSVLLLFLVGLALRNLFKMK